MKQQSRVIGNQDLEILKTTVQSLDAMLPKLGQLEVKFSVPDSQKVAPLGSAIPQFREEVSVICSEFKAWEAGSSWKQPIRDADTNELKSNMEALCTEVLLAVQNLVKIERWKEEKKEEEEDKKVEDVKEGDEEDEDDDMDLTDGHIMQHLHKELSTELKELRLAKVCIWFIMCLVCFS